MSKPTNTPSTTDEAQQGTQTEDAVIVLRHESGLTAGNTMQLRLGRYEFGPTIGERGGLASGRPSVVGFEVHVLGPQQIRIVPKEAGIEVDGRPISEPESVSPHQIIRAGADYFVFGESDDFVDLVKRPRDEIHVARATRPETKPVLPLWWLWIAIIALGLALMALVSRNWAAVALAGVLGGALAWLWARRDTKKQHALHETEIQRANAALVSELMTARAMVGRQCRAAHLSPTDLHGPTPHPLNGDNVTIQGRKLEVALGLGDVYWQPPVVGRDNAGWNYQSVVDTYSSLAAVPYLLDLNAGPVALVGSAPATASIARYLDSASRSITGESIAIISTDPSEPRPARINGPVAYVVESAENVPTSCAHIISISDAGFASVHNKHGAKLADDLVPNGLPEQADVVAATPSNEWYQAEQAVQADSFHGIKLYTSDSRIESKEMLAGIGLDLAERSDPDKLSITILDAGDRGLIRLRQLPHCVGYAAIDDDRGAEQALADLNQALAQPTDHLHVILASEFPHLLKFLGQSGRRSTAEHLAQLAQQTEEDHLIMLASSTTNEPGPGQSDAPTQDIGTAVAHLREVARSA